MKRSQGSRLAYAIMFWFATLVQADRLSGLLHAGTGPIVKVSLLLAIVFVFAVVYTVAWWRGRQDARELQLKDEHVS